MHVRISLVTEFQLELKIWIFLIKFVPKKVFLVKNGKSEHCHWILHIQISIGTKFQLKLTILIFWTKFTQKGYLWSKTEILNIITEFCMFELVWVQNFSLDWQFWFFWPNLPKKGISGLKLKICIFGACPRSFLTILIFFCMGADRHDRRVRG